MKVFEEPYNSLVELIELRNELSEGKASYELSGCIESIKPSVINGMAHKKTLVIARDEVRARELSNKYNAYSDDGVMFPAKDVMFYQADIRGNALTKERIAALKSLLGKEKTTIFVSVDSLINCMPSKSFFSDNSIKIKVGDTIDLTHYEKLFVSLGYDKEEEVEHPGEFAVRGGIVDIYPLTMEKPIRIELFGDEIDSIRLFSIENQRSIEKLKSAVIYPASEVMLSKEDIDRGMQLI